MNLTSLSWLSVTGSTGATGSTRMLYCIWVWQRITLASMLNLVATQGGRLRLPTKAER